MRLVTFLLSLLLIAAAPASAQDPSISDGSAQRALDDARARWAAADIRDYAFGFSEYCFCEGNHEPQETVVRSGAAEKGRTVEQFFAIVQRQIDRRPYRYSATYGDHGVPTSLDTDEAEGVVDDQYGFDVKDFRRLEPPPRPPAPHEAHDELADARAAWKASGIRRHSMRVTRRCAGRPTSVRRNSTVPRLHAFIARSSAAARYGRFGIPRTIEVGDCRYVVTRFRRAR